MGNQSENCGMFVTNTHGHQWYQNDPATLLEINGPVPEREFVINSRKNLEFSRGSDIQRTYSRLDYFLTMFPPPNSSWLSNSPINSYRKKEKRQLAKVRYWNCLVYLSWLHIMSLVLGRNSGPIPRSTNTCQQYHLGIQGCLDTALIIFSKR